MWIFLTVFLILLVLVPGFRKALGVFAGSVAVLALLAWGGWAAHQAWARHERSVAQNGWGPWDIYARSAVGPSTSTSRGVLHVETRACTHVAVKHHKNPFECVAAR